MIRTLRHWCNLARHCNRQALHIVPHKLDIHITPLAAVVEAQKFTDPPPNPLRSDVELDAEVIAALPKAKAKPQVGTGLGSTCAATSHLHSRCTAKHDHTCVGVASQERLICIQKCSLMKSLPMWVVYFGFLASLKNSY